MTIWLIWSQNAGKSTLFNRLIGTYRAIITDIAGTTRDIIRHEATFDGVGDVTVLDSPGLDEHENELPYIHRIIQESDCIILAIDSKTGMNSKDKDMLDLVRRAGKIGQTILFLNKIDTKPTADKLAMIMSEYYAFGLEHVVTGSARHGKIDDLKRMMYTVMVGDDETINEDTMIDDNDEDVVLDTNIYDDFDDEDDLDDELYDDLDEDTELHDEDLEYEDFETIESSDLEYDTKNIKIAIVGRPNVGKSTLINHIMKMELSKVSEIPGTTLDYLSSNIVVGDTNYTMYDTAGIRRRWSIHGLEKIAFDKTYSMLKYYQPVVIFLIDGSEGVTATDRSLMKHIMDIHLPTIVVINKIDLLEQKEKKTLLTAVQEHFGHKDRFFTVGISAKTGFGIDKIRPIVNDLWKRSHKSLTTGQLNKIIKTAFIVKPPTFPHNKAVKIYYTTQVKAYPPVFMSFINKKKNVTKAFENRLDNVVRQAGEFKWIPLQFLYRDKKMDEAGYQKHLQNRKAAIRARLKRTPEEKIAAKKKAIARAEQKRGQ